MEKIYKSQVKLLLDVLPLVSKEQCFALHGDFLLAFKDTSPIWDRYPFGEFPSIKRKVQLLLDLKGKKPEKHTTLLKKLSDVLGR
jgi:hypothetical protein